MNLVADESVDGQTVSLLRDAGYTVWYIAEKSPSIKDEEVLRISRDQCALLLTGDKDFGELVYRLKQVHSGVILIRLAGLSQEEKAQMVCSALRLHGREMMHAFTVLGRRTIRIRRNVFPGQ